MSKILLIDDDQNIIDLYSDRLKIDHHEVIVARNGAEGVAKAEKEKPDLILMDIIMPKMTGMTAMKKIRQAPWGKKLPIIMLTNIDTDDEILKGVTEDQPAYYLLKDNVTPDGVAARVKEALAS